MRRTIRVTKRGQTACRRFLLVDRAGRVSKARPPDAIAVGRAAWMEGGIEALRAALFAD
jgi:hypothetical protein